MRNDYRELVVRLRGEMEDLDRTVSKALRVWSEVEKAREDRDVYLDSVALNLSSFYSGLERLFELVVGSLDQRFPTGETWHKELLRGMAEDVPGVRPSVISDDVADALDEFRRFRHLVRNVYATNLVPGRMRNLVRTLPNLWDRLRAELLAFADFLEDLPDPTAGT